MLCFVCKGFVKVYVQFSQVAVINCLLKFQLFVKNCFELKHTVVRWQWLDTTARFVFGR